MKKALTVPREVLLLEQDRVGDTEYSYDYLCCVSATTGIPPHRLYIVGKECKYGGSSLLLNREQLRGVSDMWYTVWDKRKTYRCVATGLHAAFYLSSTNKRHGILTGSACSIMMMHIEPGMSLLRIKEEVKLGERSSRQNGAVCWVNNDLLEYWKLFREVTVIEDLMYVNHISDSELFESRARILAGLIPLRRYNTPAMKRSPDQETGVSIHSRISFKWMAVDLLNGARYIAGLPSIDEKEVTIDSRGILRIPMDSPQVEYAFASLWSKVDQQWIRINGSHKALNGEYGITIEGVVYVVELTV
jgi:hypothetical protein